MEITKYVTLETLCFCSRHLGCHRWVPTASSSPRMRGQNRNRLYYHILDWSVCLDSVFTCWESKCWPRTLTMDWSWIKWKLWLTSGVKLQNVYSFRIEWNAKTGKVSFEVAGRFSEKEEWQFSKLISPFCEILISIKKI